MTNSDVARVFARLATMLEISGANPFRVRAYREAARVVDEQAEPVATLAAEEGRLEELPGIGKDLSQKIREIVATGTTPLFEDMKKEVPLGVVEMTELQGLGPKRVKTLFEALNIRSKEELARAAEAQKLRDLPGFGETVEKNVLKALSVAGRNTGRMLLAQAWDVAVGIGESVRGIPGVEQVELAGSFRRRKETVGDLDVLATGGQADVVMSAFTSHAEVADVLVEGETKSSVRLRNDLQVDLRLVPREAFGAALVYFTGSKAHNIELRKVALDKGYSLSEYGLKKGNKTIACPTEEDVYRRLDLPWIPPELREARGEIDLARKNRLPRLIEPEDLVADLHMHTDRTDGRDDLESMVRAAKDRGYRYCAITDHSQSLTMLGGFDEARVRQSVDELATVRKKVPGIEVLHGLEVDILADGALDLSDNGLALLDLVIVSLHAKIDQPAATITRRVLKALSHPAVHVMGHPTGRAIGSRSPAAFDMEKVLDRAAELGVAMEINAQPKRMDLSDTNAQLAKQKGVPIVINTDAHSTKQLDFIKYGVFVARRAGLGKDDVLNTRSLGEFRKAMRQGGTTKPRAQAAGVKDKKPAKAQPGAGKKKSAGRTKPGSRPAKTRTAGAPKARKKSAKKRRGA